MKKPKARLGAAMPLAPEAEVRLNRQVAGLVEALEAGTDLPRLQAQVIPDPQDPQWDIRLMAALGALSHPAIPALLAALFGEARDKDRRKALKKTLHRLKTRGVAVPEDLLPREEASLGAPRPGTVRAQVTPFFGKGQSYVILEGPPEILGGNFLVSLLDDQTGFRECVLLNLKRRQQAEFWARFREQGLEPWFFPPPAYAVARLEEAYAAHPKASGAAQYGALREKIFSYWGHPEAAPDPESVLPALDLAEQTRLLGESWKLAQDPLFHFWLPGPEDIVPWLAKLKEIQDSPLVLSDQQKQVRIDGVINEATQALYPAESRADWGRRLKTMAYYLHLKGREDSRAALAAAVDLNQPERSSLTGENPFLKGLVHYALRLGWEAQHPQEPRVASGLVASGDSARLIRR